MKIRLFLILVAVVLTVTMFALHGCGAASPNPQPVSQCDQLKQNIKIAAGLADGWLFLNPNHKQSDVDEIQRLFNVATDYRKAYCSDPNTANFALVTSAIMNLTNFHGAVPTVIVVPE